LRKEDAQILGQWGARIGDIVYYYDPLYHDHMDAFGGGPIKAEIWPIPPFLPVRKEFGMLGSHHQVLPTATHGGFSVAGVLILAGPGVKKGIRRPTPVWTPDVVPTLCALSGLPLPRQAEGKVAADMFVK
jgi:arylsulfatase A-like enzyme